MLLPFWLFFPFTSTQLIPEPTRPINLWDPFGQSTTPYTVKEGFNPDEVIVRLVLGDIVGKTVILKDLPWTPNQDQTDMMPDDASHFNPNPLPPKNDVPIYTFLGIPYAEPPVSQRRFKPPQRLIKLPENGPYVAFNYANACAQDVAAIPQPRVKDLYPYEVDEDCLYLNIFSPDVAANVPAKYPVIVFFHGGNFQTGSANDWPGHGLASRGMVVVTVNYRLGAFGFMSLGDSDTGNYGLQDQRLAMEWVRDYIASFGGDPQAITIAGHDAGAASVGYHMLTPLSKGLFRSVIAASGSEVQYQSYIGKPELSFNNTYRLGRYLGCAQTVPQNLWECIMTRSMDDILRGTQTMPVEYNRYLFLPTVDGKNIPGNPLYTLVNAPSGRTTVVSPVPMLVGMNQNDGTEVLLEDRYLGEFTNFQEVDNAYLRSYAIEYCFRHNYTMNREAIAEAIVDKYTFWPDRAAVWAIRDLFIQMATDVYYTSPISLSAHLHAETGSRVFFYVNNYNFSRDNPKERFLPDWMGVCRDCDLYMAFGYPFLPDELRPHILKGVNFTNMDRNASMTFSNIYRRFAYTQNPNFAGKGSWEAYQPRRHWYNNFNYTFIYDWKVPGTMARDYRYEDVAFWNEYIPALVNYMTTTFAPEELSVRNQLVVFQWIAGVFIVVIALLLVLSLSFMYRVFEGSSEHPHEREAAHPFVDYTDNFSSNVSTSERTKTRMTNL